MYRLYPGLLPIVLLLQISCTETPKNRSAKASPHLPAQEAAITFKSSKAPHPDVLARFCGKPPGPAPIAVKMLKDKDGNIGGYTYQRLIRDSPIYYLDSEGKDLAMFHIFGPEEEKRKNGPIIDALRKAFPEEAPLQCPDTGKIPAP
jgi:hypothetical protein